MRHLFLAFYFVENSTLDTWIGECQNISPSLFIPLFIREVSPLPHPALPLRLILFSAFFHYYTSFSCDAPRNMDLSEVNSSLSFSGVTRISSSMSRIFMPHLSPAVSYSEDHSFYHSPFPTFVKRDNPRFPLQPFCSNPPVPSVFSCFCTYSRLISIFPPLPLFSLLFTFSTLHQVPPQISFTV